jgi:hypothetical protein
VSAALTLKEAACQAAQLPPRTLLCAESAAHAGQIAQGDGESAVALVVAWQTFVQARSGMAWAWRGHDVLMSIWPKVAPFRIGLECRAPATSAPGLGSFLPHLHRDWARPPAAPCHICSGTGLQCRRASTWP